MAARNNLPATRALALATTTAKKASAKKASAKKASAKKASAKKTPAKKTSAKKVSAKKAPAKKAPAKKTSAKKTPAKKTSAKKASAKKASAEKSSAKQSPAKLREGVKAPSFDLPADDGHRYSLTGLAGRRFVLYFYPRDNTSGCTTEALEFSALAGFAESGVEVLGVSPDSLASHEKFRARHGLGVVLLSDEDRAVASRYGAFGEKMMYGRTVMGIIRSTFLIGPDGTIERIWQPVRKTAGHAAAVLDAVRERVAGPSR